MPGFTIKGTMIFEQRNRGWSESYFWQRIDANLSSASVDFEILAQARAGILGEQSQIKARRVSVEYNDGIPPAKVRGDAKLLKTPVMMGVTGQASDFSDTAVLFRRENAGSTRHSNMPVRGIWDAVVGNGGVYLRSVTGWSTAVDNYRTKYRALGCGWIGEQVAATANVIASTSTDTGIVTFQTDGTPFAGITAGTRVLVAVSGINAPAGSPFNGRFVVVVVDPTSYKTLKPLAGLEVTVPGLVKRLEPVFIATDTIQDESIGERKTGAPLLESPGRRKATAKA